MSEHKKADIVGSTNKGMATAETKAPFRSFQLKIWLIGGTGVVLAAVVCLVVYHVVSTSDNKSKPSASDTGQASNDAQSTYAQDYSQSINGNPGPLKTYLSQQMAKATTTSQKEQVYSQEIVLDLNSQQYDDAISVGTQSYALSPSSQTADMVANAYEAKGDKTDAKTWFQNAINDLDKNSPTYHADLGQYTSELQELGS